MNETSTRDSISRVSGSWGFARTSNAAFEDRPAPALLLHLHGCSWVVLVHRFHGLVLVNLHRGEKRLTMATKKEEQRVREREKRWWCWCWCCLFVCFVLEIAGITIAIIAVCTKRTFFPPPFVWGRGMGIGTHTLSLLLCFYLLITKTSKFHV